MLKQKGLAVHISRCLLTACYGLFAIIFLQYSGLDQWLATLLYQLTDGWRLSQNGWLQSVIHHGGRVFVAVFVLCLLGMTLISYVMGWFNPTQRLALVYALVATLLNISLIAGLKHLTTLPCPWNVQQLGGTLPYLYLHQSFASQLATQQCFPAGHASGGYALFSLYFARKLLHLRTAKVMNHL